MTTSSRTRGDRGAASVRLVGLLLPAVVVAAGGGFALQRAVADDGAADPRPADDPPAGAPADVEGRTDRLAAPVYDCPEAPAATDVHHGDRVFATGRHEELGGWLLIRNPLDPAEQWWIEARYVAPDESMSELPELDCDDPGPRPDDDAVTAGDTGESTTTKPGTPRRDRGSTPATEPGQVTTTAAPSPAGTTPGASTTTTVGSRSTTSTGPTRRATTITTTRPTQQPRPQPEPQPQTTTTTTTTTTTSPEPTTTTTRPDTTPPSLTVSRSPDAIWEQSPGLCGNRPMQATISASASDPSGVGSVRATWNVGNHHEDRVLASGSTVLGPYPSPTIPEGPPVPVPVTVTATDSRGNAVSKTVTVMLHSAAECFG